MKNIYKKIFEFKKKEIVLVRDEKAFNYQYATLEQIQKKIIPILNDLNLMIIHSIENQKVITKIIDIESGEHIESGIDIGEVKTETKKDLFNKEGIIVGEGKESNSLDPQGIGSIITYYRRYNILALLDLQTIDDDGASGSSKAKNNQYTNNQDNAKKWYNDTDKNLEEWRTLVIQKKTTPQKIIDRILGDGYSISYKDKEKILKLF